MARFRLNVETCFLYVIWESKIKFEQKFFASPKFALLHTYDHGMPGRTVFNRYGCPEIG